MNKSQRTVLIIIIITVLGISATALSVYRIALGGGCLILAWTGLPCPTCGMTRATLCLLTGRFAEIFDYHPLFWAPYLTVILSVLTVPMKKWRKQLACAVLALALALIAVWIVRVAFFGWRG